jgi:polyferredoxin
MGLDKAGNPGGLHFGSSPLPILVGLDEAFGVLTGGHFVLFSLVPAVCTWLCPGGIANQFVSIADNVIDEFRRRFRNRASLY